MEEIKKDEQEKKERGFLDCFIAILEFIAAIPFELVRWLLG